jgi:hypothetical protein
LPGYESLQYNADSDPDPTFHFSEDPDPGPDPASLQSDAIPRILINSPSRASIHKGTLRKKTDLKTDSFLLLFTDVLFGAFGRLPNFFTNRSFYNNTATHVGGGMLTM